MELWANALVVLVCVVAAVTDTRWHRIPNWLTFPAMGAGVLLSAFAGWDGVAHSVGGLFFALIFLLPFFALDLFKAGDVKLVMAWGAIKGLGQPAWQTFALWAFLYGALLGGIMALILLAWGKARAKGWHRTAALLRMLLSGVRPSSQTDISGQTPMPYGVALSLGALMALVLEWQFGSVCPFLSHR